MDDKTRKDPRTSDGRVSIRVDKELCKDFKNLCAGSDMEPSVVTEDLLRGFIKEKSLVVAKALRAKYA